MSALVLVFVARVNEDSLLVLLPQVVVAHLGILILKQIPNQRLGRDPLLWRGLRRGVLLLSSILGLCWGGRRHRRGLGSGCRVAGGGGVGPLAPPAVVVERDAPDKVYPAREARRLPASGQGQKVWPYHGSLAAGLGSVRLPAGRLCGPPPARCQRSSCRRTTPSGGPWACQASGISVRGRVHGRA